MQNFPPSISLFRPEQWNSICSAHPFTKFPPSKCTMRKNPRNKFQFQALVFLTFLCSHQPFCRCIRRVVVLAFGNRKSHRKTWNVLFEIANRMAQMVFGHATFPALYSVCVRFRIVRLFSIRIPKMVLFHFSIVLGSQQRMNVPLYAQRTRLVETKTKKHTTFFGAVAATATAHQKWKKHSEKKKSLETNGRANGVRSLVGRQWNERIFLLTLLCRTHIERSQRWTNTGICIHTNARAIETRTLRVISFPCSFFPSNFDDECWQATHTQTHIRFYNLRSHTQTQRSGRRPKSIWSWYPFLLRLARRLDEFPNRTHSHRNFLLTAAPSFALSARTMAFSF